MEPNDTILAFDTLYTTNEIQILKLALPLLSSSLRPYVALLIKGKEMKYCLDQLPKNKMEHASLELSYLDAFLDNALPYCNDKQKAIFLQVKQLKQSLSMFEKMKTIISAFDGDGYSDFTTLFEAFGNFSPTDSKDNSDSSSTPDFSPEDFLKSSMSEEQLSMFEAFKNKFENDIL